MSRATGRPQAARQASRTLEPPKAFIPWPLPAALVLAWGVLAAYYDLGYLPLLFLTLTFGLLLHAFGFRALVFTALLFPAGYLRFEAWHNQTNPLLGMLERPVAVSGVSDGAFLTLDDPQGVRVALSPSGRVEAGRVTLQGTFITPSGKRNPGGFDYAAHLRRRGVWGQLLVREVASLTPSPPTVKERLRRGVTAGLPHQQAALMQAMTLGVRDDLGELRELFAASGLAHILALSGLHVGLLVGALALALTPLGRRRYPVLVLFVLGFVLLVGPTPSVVRAGAMTSAVLLSLWWGRGKLEPWTALALSAVLALLWNPSWLFDISFQLSYLAVVGILLFALPLTRLILGASGDVPRWWHWKSLLVGSAVLSLSAQLLTLPLIASAFGSLPLFSPLVNVVGIPLASVLVPLGFVAGLLGLVALPLASLLNAVTGFFAGALIGLAGLGSSLPNLVWGEVAPIGYALYYLALAGVAAWALGWLRPVHVLLVVAVAALCSFAAQPPNPVPELIFLDVGQGDSALIRLPGRVEILVDGGGTPFSDFDVGKRTVLPALRALGVDELELVIATHPDTDHVEGLVSLMDHMPVNQLVIGVPVPGLPMFDALMDSASRNGVPVMQVRRGEVLTLGPATLEILNPPSIPHDSENDNSVAFVLSYEGVPRALFMGDMGIVAERGLAFPDVDIVMAGHHGSRHSTSERLLRATSPRHVVISYGRNTYNHPHPDVLSRIRETNAVIHETFRVGAVRLPLAP